MTETEWLACADPTSMLEFLGGKASDRKLRLFACACCWRNRSLLGEPDQRVLEVAERYADGIADNRERRAAAKSTLFADPACLTTAVRMSEEIRHLGGSLVAYIARRCAERAAIHHCPCPIPSTAGAAYLRAVERLRRSNRWRTFINNERTQQSHLLRDVFGSPFRHASFDPAWRISDGLRLAQVAYDSCDFSSMPFLSDALEEAGCTDDEILKHCRGPGPHVRGCWVVDLILGKS